MSNRKIKTKRKRLLSSKEFVLILLAVGLLGIFAFAQNRESKEPDAEYAEVQTMESRLSNCKVSSSDIKLGSKEKKMLKDLNAYRKKKGARPLKSNQNLNRAAQWLSNDMQKKKYLSHSDSSGRSFDRRFRDCGYNGNNISENILKGANTAPKALKMWKKSSGHNQNMLNRDFTEVGIAKKGKYWTQTFGTRN